VQCCLCEEITSLYYCDECVDNMVANNVEKLKEENKRLRELLQEIEYINLNNYGMVCLTSFFCPKCNKSKQALEGGGR